MNAKPQILNVEQAAELLDIHPATLKKKANSGEIPGSKIGREWRFIDVDLLDHIRSKYKSDNNDNEPCLSSSVKIRKIGGLNSSKTESQYIEALGLQIAVKPRNITTN